MSNDLKIMICVRCGAPLKEIDDGIYECEYCKAKYQTNRAIKRTSSNQPIKLKTESISQNSFNSVEANNQKRKEKNEVFHVKNKKHNAIFIFLYLFFVIIIAYILLNLPIFSDPELKIENEMKRYPSGLSTEWDLPSDFVHHEKYSVGVVLEDVTVHGFRIGIPVYNRNMDIIKYESKYENFDIKSINVSDNRNRLYDCTFIENKSYRIEKDKDYPIGRIDCDDLIYPDVRFLIVQIVFENFGTENFNLDLSINPENLVTSASMYKNYDNESFAVRLYGKSLVKDKFVISIDIRTISVVDNEGNFYKCNFDYYKIRDNIYISTVGSSQFDNGYSFASFNCEPGIPEDINRLVITYTLQNEVRSSDILITSR